MLICLDTEHCFLFLKQLVHILISLWHNIKVSMNLRRASIANDVTLPKTYILGHKRRYGGHPYILFPCTFTVVLLVCDNCFVSNYPRDGGKSFISCME